MKIFDLETTGLSRQHKIVVFGIKDFQGEIRVYKEWELGEKGVINKVVEEFRSARQIIGYNIENFDLPFIKARMEELGMYKELEELEKILKEKEIIDVFRIIGYGALQVWARRIGVSLRLPEINGGQIPKLYYAKEFEKIVLHNLDDLIACEKIFEKIQNGEKL